MSFPHRTAYYLPNSNSILDPAKAESHLGALKDTKGVIVSQDNPYSKLKTIPLASTGLEDSKGNEIFEGHIITCDSYPFYSEGNLNYVGIVVYIEGCFYCELKTISDRVSGCAIGGDLSEYHQQATIQGHSLTDPDLVPDSFDTEEYFDL